MPSMANITVLDAAAANVQYTAQAASAGDRVPAVWNAKALGTYNANHPYFSMMSRDNGKRTARHVSFVFRFPVLYTDSDGIERVQAIIPLSCEGTLPTNIAATVVKDAFIQFGNLLVASLIRDAIEAGYAPT